MSEHQYKVIGFAGQPTMVVKFANDDEYDREQYSVSQPYVWLEIEDLQGITPQDFAAWSFGTYYATWRKPSI